MNFKNLFLPCLFLLLFSSFGMSQGTFSPVKDDAAFRRKLAQASRSVNTIESSFTQEKIMDVLSEKITSHGKFFFRKESDLRWEYTDPVKYLIIFRNGNILIRNDQKESSFDTRSGKVFSEINDIIIGSVRGTLFEDKSRFSSSFFESPNRYLVKMQPLTKNLKSTLKEIRLYFDRKDITVAEIEMVELSGDITRIEFHSKKINSPLPDDIFISK